MELLVNIDVDDVARAEAFYTTALGLRAGRRFGDTGVELIGGSSRIYLLAKAPDTEPTSQSGVTRSYDRHWTPVHLDVVVEDLELAVRAATTAGAVLERPIQSSSWGKLALMVDPLGHGFCLLQFLGRGYDEIASQ